MMTVVGILGVKGGTGTSLVAVNLGVALAKLHRCILIDLHTPLGYDDMLLDLEPKRSWGDLLPVADELTARHLELTAAEHASGLRLLAASATLDATRIAGRLPHLVESLGEHAAFVLLDLPVVGNPIAGALIPLCRALLLVTTADPPALRAARRLLEGLPLEIRSIAGLVLNQISWRHPADPAMLAASLAIPLWAALAPDPPAVGRQVNFGQVCVDHPESSFGRGVASLAQQLRRTLLSGPPAGTNGVHGEHAHE